MTSISEKSTTLQGLSSDSPIAIDPIQPEDAPGSIANKYKWPEFSRLTGERHLDAILQKILPSALHRTWRDMVHYQLPGRDCYVGAARVSREIAKVGERKIYLDLEELRNRGLLKISYARMAFPQVDGRVRVETVSIKNFDALYDLAHEYHEWLHSPDYIEPSRENAEFILASPRLVASLMRFDDYRRILCNRKPGPKAQPKPAHLLYTCQLGSDDQPAGAISTEAPVSEIPGTFDPKPNLYLHKQLIKDSPKRRDVMATFNGEDDSTIRSAIAQTQKEEVSLSSETGSHIAPTAICNDREEKRNEDESPKSEPQDTAAEPVKQVKDAIVQKNTDSREAPVTEGEQAAQTAGIPLDQWRELARRYGSQVAGQSEKPRKVVVPLFIQGIMEVISKSLGDVEHGRSNETQAANLYLEYRSRLNQEEFTSSLYKALEVTQTQRGRGRVKKKPMQYFFGTLRSTLRDCAVTKALTFEKNGLEEVPVAPPGLEPEPASLVHVVIQDQDQQKVEVSLPEARASQEVQTEAEQIEQLEEPQQPRINVTEPQDGWSSWDGANYWANRLREHYPYGVNEYCYDVQPAYYEGKPTGRWLFIFYARCDLQHGWAVYGSKAEVDFHLQSPEKVWGAYDGVVGSSGAAN